MKINSNHKNHVINVKSWEAVDRAHSKFTPDLTPLMLAAHLDNFEIIKILLDRGAAIPSPHDLK